MKETYFIIDIEADGPIPGPYSMLSFACVAMSSKGDILGEYEANLECLENASQHPETMAFWANNSKAYDTTRINTRDPALVMDEFANWVRFISGNTTPVMVAYPAGFDFTFIYWYLVKFNGASVFSWSCLDMKSVASVVLDMPYSKSIKKNFPRSWFDKNLKHTHKAIDDARGQAYTFRKMYIKNENRNTV